VAVEKVGFSEKSRKSGDRKCPGDWEKSFVELPDAIQFLQILGERVFQQPPLFATLIWKRTGFQEYRLSDIRRLVNSLCRRSEKDTIRKP
jgi:hypothetical protein